MVYNQGPYSAPSLNKSKVSTPKPQDGIGGGSYVEKPLYSKCERKHDGKCVVGTGNFYGCCKRGHIVTSHNYTLEARIFLGRGTSYLTSRWSCTIP